MKKRMVMLRSKCIHRQLCSDEDVIEQALQGANVAVLTDCGRMGNYVKEMGILNAAYFADSYEEMEKFMNTDVVKPHMDESTCFLLPA